MERKDYILREIERMAVVVARIRDLILGRATSLAAVRAELANAAASLGLDLQLGKQVTPETLLMLAPPRLDVSKTWFLAESFYLQGLEAHLAGNAEEAADLLLRSRMLFEGVSAGGYNLAQFPEATSRIEAIDSMLDSARASDRKPLT